MKNIYLQIIENKSDGSWPVLATVARTDGSTPQKPGSSALFNEKGLLAGTVGGGVVEGRIQKIAIDRFNSEKSGYFSFDLLNDISKKEEAICGGQINILVDADIKEHIGTFRQLKASLDKNIPGVLVTIVSGASENEASISRYWATENSKLLMPDDLWKRISTDVTELISAADPTDFREVDLQGQGDKADSFLLLEPVFPPLKLVIAGAGHIGRALAHLGSILGFEIIVIDDRPEYANFGNIPDAGDIILCDIGEAVTKLKKGPDTYLVIVTRGHKDDASALKSAIGSDLAYTGMIGSRKKIESMRMEFIKEGWATPEQWSSVFTPIGLEINSQTIEEIAVSIAAQIIMVKNSKKNKRSGCPA